MNGTSIDRDKVPIELVAYHEAGHVMAHIVLRVPFSNATIRPILGYCSGYVTPYDSRDMDEPEPDLNPTGLDGKQIVIDLAGPVCECMFSRLPYFWESEGKTYTYPEVTKALDILRERTCLSEEEVFQHLVHFVHRTERMLVRHSSKVHLIAAALLDNKHLTAQQIRWLLVHYPKPICPDCARKERDERNRMMSCHPKEENLREVPK